MLPASRQARTQETGMLFIKKSWRVPFPGLLAVVALAVCFDASRAADGQQHRATRWLDARVAGPFVCRAEFSLVALEGLLGQLGQLQNDLVQSLGIPPAQESIELYLFRNQSTYSQFLKQNLPNVPYRKALFVKSEGPGRVYAYYSRALATDLRHECTHALLHAVLPMVPLWLDEGLAEYFEVTPQRRAFDNPYLGPLRWNLRFGLVPPLTTLEKKGDVSDMGQAEYRYAWAWVHFMLHGPPKAHEELVGFLAAIRASTPPGLLSQRLERRLTDARRQLAAHFRRWKR